jgi:hypothetical protein
MKKVKEWLEESKKQFVVKDRFASYNIRSVQRIKDDAIFYVGPYRCAAYFKIIDFDEDCINVKIKCASSLDASEMRYLRCNINDIELSEDGSAVVSWSGITDDGTEIDDTPDPEDLPTMTNPGTSLLYSD